MKETKACEFSQSCIVSAENQEPSVQIQKIKCSNKIKQIKRSLHLHTFFSFSLCFSEKKMKAMQEKEEEDLSKARRVCVYIESEKSKTVK